MKSFRRIGEGLLLAAIIFLFFIVLFEQRMKIPDWLHVAGRMHPMFLHFPIVLLIVFFLTLWLPLKEDNESWISALGLVAALSAVITAIMGLILSLEETRTGSVFQWHKWGGIAIALMAFIFYSFHSFFKKQKALCRPLTLLASAGILVTGHWGADLTHGENYLLAPLTAERKKASVEEAFVYADIVQPILEEKCMSCHSASSSKGGLSLSDTASLLYGGKTGPLFIPGKADLSLLIQRIHLPVEEKKHMPPKEKAQLTEEEKLLLFAWIKSGAPLNSKLISLPATDSFRILATQYLAPSDFSGNHIAYDFPAADAGKINSLNTNYRAVKPLGAASPALSVDFYGRSNFSSKALEELLAVKDQIVELNLAKMPVKDEDLKLVQKMPNLVRLNLNYTDITSKGLTQLNKLKNLQQLALSGTDVQQQELAALLKLPQLSSVYLWDTKLDSNQVALLRRQFKNTKLETGYLVEKDTTIYTLNPPTIKTQDGIFEGSNYLEVKHGIKGVEIRYTIDGSTPDSVNSPIYKEPIFTDSSVVLKVKAYKTGWHSSATAERNFIRRGVTIDSIELISEPDKTINPKHTSILKDEAFGNPTIFRNGKWFGYLKNEAAFYLHFEEPVAVQQLWMAILDNPGGSIFPPEKIEIWGGNDKQHLKLLSKTTPKMPEGYDPAATIQMKQSFPKTTVKYLKLVMQPIKHMPVWHYGKGKPGWILLSELIVN